MGLRTVGLIVNRTKWEAIQFAHEVIAWLTERDVEVFVDAAVAPLMGRDDIACEDDRFAEVDLLITLGGDGTILNASHIAAPHGIPLLGVHMGHFGFIAESHPNDLLQQMDSLLEGRMEIEERMMLRAEVLRNDAPVFQEIGLNDIVINKGATARMLHLRTAFSGELLASYPADGVIVATPTGSTAYNLSAGGPLVEPTVQALLVTPICPHSLAARPLVIPADETVSVTIESDGGEVLCIADSYRIFPLGTGDRVVIQRAEFPTRIVRLQQAGFYRKVRQRLLWGERLNA